jgi:hypothetical protein
MRFLRWCPMMPCEITSSLAFVIKKKFTKYFHFLLHQNITYIFLLWPTTTCIYPFDFSRLATQHNSPAHERDVRTRRQQNMPGCLLCVDFRFVNRVQKSPQSNMILIDITGDQTCMFRTEKLWSTVTCGITVQAMVNNQTASAYLQTKKLRGKPYSLDSRDIHAGSEAAVAWNWPHLNLVQEVTMHGNRKYHDRCSHTWRSA